MAKWIIDSSYLIIRVAIQLWHELIVANDIDRPIILFTTR